MQRLQITQGGQKGRYSTSILLPDGTESLLNMYFLKLASIHVGATHFPMLPQASASWASGQNACVCRFSDMRPREPVLAWAK